MALMKLSGLVSGLAGKLNGSQFNNSSSGLILQNKCQQKRVGSSGQLQWRQNFKLAANYWKTLTPEQQQANNDAALNYPYTDRFGDTRYYNGYQLLLRSNSNMLAIGENLINEVPLIPPTNESFNEVLLDVLLDSGVTPVFFLNTINFSGDFSSYSIVVYISPALSSGVKNYTGKFSRAYVYPAINESFLLEGVNVPFANEWSVGKRIFVELKAIENSSGIETAFYNNSYIIFEN